MRKIFSVVIIPVLLLVCMASSALAGDLENRLLDAASNGQVDEVRALLAQGAAVNAKDSYIGATALMRAALNGHVDVVRVLLDRGADMNAKNNNGCPALILAAQTGQADVVRVLLDRGADVNAKADNGFTSLMQAVVFDKVDVVRVLLDAHADVNARSNTGRTALMLANAAGKSDIVQLLKKAGADGEIRVAKRGGVVPDGFVGVPWGANSSQIIKIMSDRGYRQLDSSNPSELAFEGAFAGIPSDLHFSLLGNSFFRGWAHSIRQMSLMKIYERNIIRDLSNKYGPPGGKSGDDVSADTNTWWEFSDSRTSDKYQILILGMKNKSGDTNLYSLFISYTDLSLEERLKKKEY